jgi:16S rRNA (cytidine1402-2'-O)-methyltransferase
MNNNTLYIIPTPIGNIQDITIRSLNILKLSEIIIAESIRNTIKLFNKLNIKTKKIIKYNIHNENKITNFIINLIKNNKVSYITNAGTPGISDPGFLLIKECIKHDIKICCLPGPTAIIPALIQSGAPMHEFTFLGFLPKKKKIKKIKELNKEKRTVVIYESPNRILSTLYYINKFTNNTYIIVCKEISKKFEEIFRGSAEEIMKLLQNTKIKGEFVIVIEKLKQKQIK